MQGGREGVSEGWREGTYRFDPPSLSSKMQTRVPVSIHSKYISASLYQGS